MNLIAIFDIDGVIRDVSTSYRKALIDTVTQFTNNAYVPTMNDIDNLKEEGIWNNDWEASQELIYRYFESVGKSRDVMNLDYQEIVNFFQARYRGTNPNNWNGYITTEKLLVEKSFFQSLTDKNIKWGFFSGATRKSAEYVLNKRLNLDNPILIAMEDAPSKPDPSGLFLTVEALQNRDQNDDFHTILYLGDTVADMITIVKAKAILPQKKWLAIGVLPPHISADLTLQKHYIHQLEKAGADLVLNNINELIFHLDILCIGKT